MHGTALAWWRRRILLRGGDIGATVGTPGAPSAVRHAGVADLAAVHQGAAEQASAEAVLRLQTAHTAARLDVGAHLDEGGGLAPELAAGGAAVEADTRGGEERPGAGLMMGMIDRSVPPHPNAGPLESSKPPWPVAARAQHKFKPNFSPKK